MAGVVSLDLELGVHLDHLVKIDRDDLLHAVLDHARGEEVLLPLLVHRNLPHVLEQDGRDGLGGHRHVDGPVVADHLRHVGQRPAVVQVEVGDDDGVDVLGQRLVRGHVGEVWEPAVVVVAHVHAAVEHHVLAADGEEETRPAHILARAQRGHFDIHTGGSLLTDQ